MDCRQAQREKTRLQGVFGRRLTEFLLYEIGRSKETGESLRGVVRLKTDKLPALLGVIEVDHRSDRCVGTRRVSKADSGVRIR